jgi:hypothetical protein
MMLQPPEGMLPLRLQFPHLGFELEERLGNRLTRLASRNLGSLLCGGPHAEEEPDDSCSRQECQNNREEECCVGHGVLYQVWHNRREEPDRIEKAMAGKTSPSSDQVTDNSDQTLLTLLEQYKIATDPEQIKHLSEEIERVTFHKQFENA